MKFLVLRSASFLGILGIVLFDSLACVLIAEPMDQPVLNIGLVIHLEGWPLHQNEGVLERYEEIVSEYADLFESYGAKLTLETRNTTDAILQYDGRHNFLSELQSRGHAVGVHADLGGRPGLTFPSFVNQLTEMRQKLSSLGINVRHVSGICSYLDWVTAAIEARFEYATSSVAYCYSSLPEEERPEEFRNCPGPAQCHQLAPAQLLDRLHPWRAENGLTWPEHNPNGRLVLVPSSGTINCFAEERSNSDSFTNCEFNQADIDAYIEELQASLSLIRSDKVYTHYVVWSLGSQLDPALLEQWLQAITPYVDSGQVIWSTVTEMVDLYYESESY